MGLKLQQLWCSLASKQHQGNEKSARDSNLLITNRSVTSQPLLSKPNYYITVKVSDYLKTFSHECGIFNRGRFEPEKIIFDVGEYCLCRHQGTNVKQIFIFPGPSYLRAESWKSESGLATIGRCCCFVMASWLMSPDTNFLSLNNCWCLSAAVFLIGNRRQVSAAVVAKHLNDTRTNLPNRFVSRCPFHFELLFVLMFFLLKIQIFTWRRLSPGNCRWRRNCKFFGVLWFSANFHLVGCKIPHLGTKAPFCTLKL